jgi:ATP synthase protein I
MAWNGSTWRPILSLMSVGFVLVAAIVLGYLLGSWADRKLGTHPWGVVAGVVLGTAAGFLELFRTVNRSLK